MQSSPERDTAQQPLVSVNLETENWGGCCLGPYLHCPLAAASYARVDMAACSGPGANQRRHPLLKEMESQVQ